MSYIEVIEETATRRVVLHLDECPGEPDSDGQGHIVQASTGDRVQTTVRHADYSRPAEAEALGDALRLALAHALYYAHTDVDEWEFAERYLRAFHGVVAFDRVDWDRDTLVCVVTRELALAWGLAPDSLLLYGRAQVEELCSGLAEWRAYREGDVYGYVVQQKVHRVVTHDGAVVEDDDDWVDTDDSCWGFYGSEYAEEAAREALAAHAVD